MSWWKTCMVRCDMPKVTLICQGQLELEPQGKRYLFTGLCLKYIIRWQFIKKKKHYQKRHFLKTWHFDHPFHFNKTAPSSLKCTTSYGLQACLWNILVSWVYKPDVWKRSFCFCSVLFISYEFGIFRPSSFSPKFLDFLSCPQIWAVPGFFFLSLVFFCFLKKTRSFSLALQSLWG